MTDTTTAHSEPSQPLGLALTDGLGAGAMYEACDFGVLTGRWMDKPFGVMMRVSGGFVAYRSPMGGQPRFASFAAAQDKARELNRIVALNAEIRGD